MTPNNPENTLGPRSVGLFAIILRTLGGLGGGVVGTGLIVVIAFLGASILNTALTPTSDGAVHPLFVFVFMAMMFIGSLAANILGPLFIGLSDREKYRNISTTLYQIFIANMVILVVMAPIYMIVAGLQVESIASVAALEVVVSAFVSALILEVIADTKYALLGVYSTAFSILVSAGLYFLFYTLASEQPMFLLFLALPVIWVSIGLFSGLLGYLYGWIYKLYGVDFLSTAVSYGQDVKWESEEEEVEKEVEQEDAKQKKKDDSGAKFLER